MSEATPQASAARAELSSTTPPFAALPTAPGLARAHVRGALSAWSLGACSDTAELVVGELVANAINASAGLVDMPLIQVCVIVAGDALMVEV